MLSLAIILYVVLAALVRLVCLVREVRFVDCSPLAFFLTPHVMSFVLMVAGSRTVNEVVALSISDYRGPQPSVELGVRLLKMIPAIKRGENILTVAHEGLLSAATTGWE